MKKIQPEDRERQELELERIMELISAGTIEDIDDLDPEDLALMVSHHGSQEEVERIIDQFSGPPE
jgi:hypothetical protein